MYLNDKFVQSLQTIKQDISIKNNKNFNTKFVEPCVIDKLVIEQQVTDNGLEHLINHSSKQLNKLAISKMSKINGSGLINHIKKFQCIANNSISNTAKLNYNKKNFNKCLNHIWFVHITHLAFIDCPLVGLFNINCIKID